MAGVRIQRDIGQDAQFREALFQFAHCAWHQSLRIDGFDAVWGLQGRINDWEQREHRNAELHAVFRDRQQQVDRQPLHTRHRGDGLALVFAIEDEDRINQVGGGDDVLSHHRA